MGEGKIVVVVVVVPGLSVVVSIGGGVVRICGILVRIFTSGPKIRNSNGLSVIFSKIICIGLYIAGGKSLVLSGKGYPIK